MFLNSLCVTFQKRPERKKSNYLFCLLELLSAYNFIESSLGHKTRNPFKKKKISVIIKQALIVKKTILGCAPVVEYELLQFCFGYQRYIHSILDKLLSWKILRLVVLYRTFLSKKECMQIEKASDENQ